MKRICCPCCGGGMRGTKREALGIKWQYCRACGHSFLPISELDNIKAQQGRGIPPPERARQFKKYLSVWRAEWMKARYGAAKAVLDIGPGDGGFLYCLPDAELRHGLTAELAMKPPDKAITFIRGAFLHDGLPAQYDWVTAWQVLEHLIPLQAALARMVDLCVDGGVVGVEVPVERRLARDTYIPPHPHGFTATSWAHVLHSIADRVEFDYVGVGFCKSSVLMVARKLAPERYHPGRKGKPLNELVAACKEGGKKRWHRVQRQHLGHILDLDIEAKRTELTAAVEEANA